MPHVFSRGLELADVVLASGLLHRSLAVIHELNVEFSTKKNIRTNSSSPLVAYKTCDENCWPLSTCDQQKQVSNYTFSVGVAGPSSVLSPTLEPNPPEFNFLQIKDSSFSINEEAIKLFRFLSQECADLFQLKDPASKALIITGLSEGGWVASLYCLWLRSGWYARFLHVVSDGDLIPHTFVSSTANNSYKPFGTFLVCSSSPSACACFEDPDSVLSVLVATGGSFDQMIVSNSKVEKLLEDLTRQMIVSTSNGVSQIQGSRGNPLRAGIILRLDAIGVTRTQRHLPQKKKTLIRDMESRERKNYHEHVKRISETIKKLAEMFITMVHHLRFLIIILTYYYHNHPKKKRVHESLTKFWEDAVKIAETMPTRNSLPTRLLCLIYRGANYMKMVEPLAIADHYKRSKISYRKEGRSKHYKLLETWQDELYRGEYRRKLDTRNTAASMTQDSCFWADNREAMGGLEESHIQKLEKFEDHVMGLIDGLAVSPEIFLECTFMEWWKEYQTIPEP
ncbi:hypothetical protein NE237_021795 [Protea cynaroides]|uniref:EDS1 EP domain-containing protein n=1 Tax=Protea cynaroides TaxID=273540 RepID=A0A9Q0HC03_9MAGN|nr:hypothetical protein NE237_021795 [Protea cynaroides]